MKFEQPNLEPKKDSKKAAKKAVASVLAGVAAMTAVEAQDVQARSISSTTSEHTLHKSNATEKAGVYTTRDGKKYSAETKKQEKEMITNEKQAWEYLLFNDEVVGSVVKSLQKIQEGFDFKTGKSMRIDNPAGVLNRLNINKEMGTAIYAKSLGLNYYILSEDQKLKARRSFDNKLEKIGLALYMKTADDMKSSKKEAEDKLLQKCLEYEEQLKTPAIKIVEEENIRTTGLQMVQMTISNIRKTYLSQGMSVEEVAKEVIRLYDNGAKRDLDERNIKY